MAETTDCTKNCDLFLMSDPTNICADGHICRHGSLCTPHPYDEGSYYCDCDATFLQDKYAGLSCEHTATTLCEVENNQGVEFCTNNGSCAVGGGSLVCECPTGYTGNQCQFVEGTKVPDNHPLYGEAFNAEFADAVNNNNSGGGLGGGIVAVIVILVVVVIIAGAIFVYRKKKLHAIDPTRPTVAAPELMLDADGQVLKEAVKSGAGVSSTNTSNGFHDVEADDMVDLSLSPAVSAEDQTAAAPTMAVAAAVPIQTSSLESPPPPVERAPSPEEEEPPTPPSVSSSTVENGGDGYVTPPYEDAQSEDSEETPPEIV